MLVPVLVWQFGPKEAVPIMAVAAVMANLARILAWWREIDWRACAAFAATEAASSLAIFTAKVLAFRSFGAMPLDVFVKGLIAGSSLMAGTFLSKRLVLKLDAEAFRYILDGLMLASGLAMLWNAFVS